jgi:hypothetical protein
MTKINLRDSASSNTNHKLEDCFVQDAKQCSNSTPPTRQQQQQQQQQQQIRSSSSRAAGGSNRI